MEKCIHTTIGLYNNGEHIMNGVQFDKLAEHIKYNINNRIGRALFLDGVCIFRGYLSQETVEKFEKSIKNDSRFIAVKDTAPYI